MLRSIRAMGRAISRHTLCLARLGREHQPLLLGGTMLALLVLGLSGCMLTSLLQAPSLLALLAASLLGLGACVSSGSSKNDTTPSTPVTPPGPPPAVQWPATLDLARLAGHGVTLLGSAHWGAGWSLSSGLDVSGDGIDDLLIGTYSVFSSDPVAGLEDNPQGAAYLIFGSKTFGSGAPSAGLDMDANLAALGRKFIPALQAHAGYSVALAPDVTGDGKNDLLIGSNAGPQPNGIDDFSVNDIAWAIAGPVTKVAPPIVPLPNFAAAVPTPPFSAIVNGGVATQHDRLGFSVAVVGLLHDTSTGVQNVLAMGAPVPAAGSPFAPSVNVLFSPGNIGRTGIGIATLNPGTNFVFTGAAGSQTGWSVADAGDINGDGINDLIIGAPGAGPGGEVYVVFGLPVPNPGFPTSPAALTGTNGFAITNTGAPGAQTGWTVAPAGDVNGDGISDFMINVPGIGFTGHVGGLNTGGKVYVIFGRALGTAWPPTIDLGALGTQGFAIIMPNGASARSLGHGVFNTKYAAPNTTTATYSTTVGSGSSAVIVPVSDIVIGVPGAIFPPGVTNDGAVVVLFGNNNSSVPANPPPWAATGSVDLNTAAVLGGSNKGGFVVAGAAGLGLQVGWSVAVGDLNGDGTADLILGAPYNDASDDGAVYVLYGLKPGQTYP